MLYMALHFADPEVTKLMNEYAQVTGMSKTEALRRLLHDALHQHKRNSKKEQFQAVARRIIEKNRRLTLRPITKKEADSIF